MHASMSDASAGTRHAAENLVVAAVYISYSWARCCGNGRSGEAHAQSTARSTGAMLVRTGRQDVWIDIYFFRSAFTSLDCVLRDFDPRRSGHESRPWRLRTHEFVNFLLAQGPHGR